MPDEFSESGAPVHRYDQPAEQKWTPPDQSDSSMEEIERHIEAHVGKVDSVFHEVVSDLVHIDIHLVPPTTARPYITLVTSGMSDRPMATPDEAAELRYAELMLCLPASWDLTSHDEADYWPIRWLKLLARFPHQYQTWLAELHSMPNGDPAEPMAPNTELCGIMLGRPMTLSVDFHRLPVRADKTIHFYSVLPVYQDEMDFKLKQGGEALVHHLERAKVTELLDVQRPSVVKRAWWRLF